VCRKTCWTLDIVNLRERDQEIRVILIQWEGGYLIYNLSTSRSEGKAGRTRSRASISPNNSDNALRLKRSHPL
jgi:hypothetical protein